MYNKTILDGGIRVVSEAIEQVRSVSIGVWVLCGARYEEEASSGMCHFLEHMLFKGTTGRAAYDIAAAIDSIGGIMNAFTGKELTAYYIKVPDYHLTVAIDLLADMFTNSLFDQAEIEKEKSVVIQEISLLDDSPDDYIHDYFESTFWNGQSLGRPVLGTRDSVGSFSREGLGSFFQSRYSGGNLVISATGNVDHRVLVDLVREAFSGQILSPVVSKDVAPVSSAGIHVLERDLEQVHLIIGTDAPAAVSDRRYAALIINALLGGCMSSRLFQEIRERRGLAYSVHSFLASYLDTGILGIYTGAAQDKIGEIIQVVMAELERFREVALSDGELTQAKELIKGNYLLSMESTDTRLSRLAKNEICFNRYVSSDEFIGYIEGVRREDVLSLAQ
ncbi:MAG: pitrilysin family protein, partial [Smithellaceae bacterium]|nr:pitrilysin family protein [Smithellaceae bacterium]